MQQFSHYKLLTGLPGLMHYGSRMSSGLALTCHKEQNMTFREGYTKGYEISMLRRKYDGMKSWREFCEFWYRMFMLCVTQYSSDISVDYYRGFVCGIQMAAIDYRKF